MPMPCHSRQTQSLATLHHIPARYAFLALMILGMGLTSSELEARTLQGRIGIYMDGLLAQAFMGDLNRMIRDQHCAFITREPNAALDEMTGGFGLSMGVDYGLNDRLLLGLEYELLYPSVETRIGSWLYPDRLYGIYLDAAEYSAGIQYLWEGNETFVFHLGFQLVFLHLQNAREFYQERVFLTAVRTLDRIEYSGSTLGAKLTAGADIFIWDFLSWNSNLGFRYACIGQVTGTYLDGSQRVMLNPDGSKFSLDYSGVFFKSGIKFWF